MGLTSTKRGRLAVIVAVAVVIIGSIAIFNAVSASNADAEARRFAGAAYEQLRSIDYDEVDQLSADALVAEWEGESASAFEVDGLVPQVITEVPDGLVARYRIQSSGTERCVDAMWRPGAPFAVTFNGCEGYDRP